MTHDRAIAAPCRREAHAQGMMPELGGLPVICRTGFLLDGDEETIVVIAQLDVSFAGVANIAGDRERIGGFHQRIQRACDCGPA